MDWFVWRIATSDQFRDTYADIMDRWRLCELLDAHLLLDAVERAQRAANKC